MDRKLSVALALLLLTSFVVATPAAARDAAAECRFPADLAERLLAGGIDFGDLPVEASFVMDEELLLDEGRLRATVEGMLEVGPLRMAPSATLCVFLLLDVDGEAHLAHQQRIPFDDFSTVESLRYVLRADLPEGTRHMTFVVRDAESKLWGAVPMQEPGGEIAGPGFTAVRVDGTEGTWYEVRHRAGGSRRADAAGEPTAGSSTDAAPEATADARPSRSPDRPDTQIVRIVPPRDQPVRGRETVYTLTSSVAVDAVRFELDGEQIQVDGRKPYRARIPFADPPRVQTLRVVALDSRGLPMDEDVILVNELDRPFRARFTALRGDPASGSVTVAAEATTPAGATLDRLELWYGEELVETFAAPRFETEVATPDAGPTDYLRVAAHLADGSSIDDVVLLADPASVESVDVNLVQVHVVVTGEDGRPVTDLEPGDFAIEFRGEEREIQSFAYADDVPLVLGLMVDSSGSMQLLMHDTQKAAAKFLGSTVLPGDKAFLVDFDLQPRVLHPVTKDVVALMQSLGDLNADGRTAMYDAVVFSLLQFEEHRGRRALVILSDGDDLDSRFGPKHVVDMARGAGVPVYLIGLGSLDTLYRTYDKGSLEKLTGETGGRLYFVNTFEELNRAYDQINAELRSQYTLGFYVESDLSQEERREVEVEVPGDRRVRAVIGVGAVAE